MKQKIKNLKRRWRKLDKWQRMRLGTTAALAIIFLPFTPLSTLWLLLIMYTIGTEIRLQRISNYIYYKQGVGREIIRNIKGQKRLLDLIDEGNQLLLDLLDKYNHLRAAYNKLLRRRRKENNQ
jgi:amino acid transporter